MEKNEIKKALYRQKPIAKKSGERIPLDGSGVDSYGYKTTLDDGTVLHFLVPVKDMGDATFYDEMDAKLLIRWLVA